MLRACGSMYVSMSRKIRGGETCVISLATSTPVRALRRQ
jgi:hypothetical protein